MVPIFTYRDERKLLTVIGGLVLVALIAFFQITEARTGKPSPISTAVLSALTIAQTPLALLGQEVGGALGGIADIPRLWQENAALRDHDRELTAENAALREGLSEQGDLQAIDRAEKRLPHGIVADTIGYDPESQMRTISIDRGSISGVALDAGVVNDDGVVGRVLRVTPLSSTVLLVTDSGSKVPAVVQRGRWWGIVAGLDGHLTLQYVSQDARLSVGDMVVTGDGRSFHAGLPIGRIAKVYHPDGSLYQTAVLTPTVAFGRLQHVIVLPKNH